MKVVCPHSSICTTLPCMHATIHDSNANCYAESVCPDCKEAIKYIRKKKLKSLKRKSLN